MDNDYILFRLKGGDMKILGQVFEEYHQVLYGYAYNILRNEDEAKDAVQDAFVKLCQNKKNWKEIIDVRAYLAISVRNRCLQLIQQEKKKLAVIKGYSYLPDVDLHEAEAIIGTQNDHLAYVVEGILEEIPVKRRRIFLLYCFENYTYTEIGMKLGLTRNTIKTQLRLARGQIANFKHLLTGLLILFLF